VSHPLYEDAHILVFDKPAGLLTQGPAVADTLEAHVQRHLSPERPDTVYLGTVHRLDRPVSGVVLWAKTEKAARRLAMQFAERRVRKEYWAIVEGQPADGQGIWDDWLCTEDTGLGRVQRCRPGTPRARRAVTQYERGDPRAIPEGCAWLRLAPETGRTHQIRAQAATRGLPIVGDQLYGATRTFPEGIALHARALTIQHPTLDRPMTFEADLPASWAQWGFVA
jgi:23S rRNA pseudouridine1911/1915/1917 synthase